MKSININYIYLIILFINISLIYAQSQVKYEIPLSYTVNTSLPVIEILLGEETNPNPFVLDIGQEKSWIYKKREETTEKKNLETLQYNIFSVDGEAKKDHCYLSNKEKNKILKIGNFDYLEVPKVNGDEPFLNGASLNNIVSNAENFDHKDKNYGFNIDFPSKKLSIGKFDDNEKQNLKKLELKGNKWQFTLNAVFFDDINKNVKNGNEYKILNTTKGILVNKDILLETVYAPFYVPKDFFDYLEDNSYFYDEKDKLCERKIEQGSIIYLCDKNKKDKIKNMNLVLNNKYVLPLTKKHLLKCSTNSELCEFVIKYNPKVKLFALGVDFLKNLNVYFMKNENSVYLKGIEIFDCDMAASQFKAIGQKDIMKALFQLFKTFSVIILIFVFLFIFFYVHSKFRGNAYTDKENDDKKDEELVDIDKEKN